jgi:hypothetical protein
MTADGFAVSAVKYTECDNPGWSIFVSVPKDSGHVQALKANGFFLYDLFQLDIHHMIYVVYDDPCFRGRLV